MNFVPLHLLEKPTTSACMYSYRHTPSLSTVPEKVDNPPPGVSTQGGQPLNTAALKKLVITEEKDPLDFDIDTLILELRLNTEDPGEM